MTNSHGKLAFFNTPLTFGQGLSGGQASLGRFDFLFQDLTQQPQNLLPATNTIATSAALMALGNEMIESGATAGPDMTIPPIYTYFGQFCDHDITLQGTEDPQAGEVFNIDPARTEPIPPQDLLGLLRNGRDPRLNLDSLYGPRRDGRVLPMTAAGTKFLMATAPSSQNEGDIQDGDLPRYIDEKEVTKPDGTVETVTFHRALIGDERNDENLLVSQLHLAFIKFHNRIVDALIAGTIIAPLVDIAPDATQEQRLFAQAQRLTQWHYQWIVLNDYLPNICDLGIVTKLRDETIAVPTFTGMPVEFAGAAFRFGHSMVRENYDYNRHFGKEGTILQSASFALLFLFTGGGGFNGETALPSNWVIDWDRFINPNTQKARGIDTMLAPALADMKNETKNNEDQGVPQLGALLRMLAQRNLLRGYLMSLPTGEAVANAINSPPLTPDELGANPAVRSILEGDGLQGRTPLWFYILKESEVRAGSQSLGEVGSFIVASTFIRLLKDDPNSILNAGKNWTPAQGANVINIAQLVKFESQNV